MSPLLDYSADLKGNSSILPPEIIFHSNFTVFIPVYARVIEVFMINDVPLRESVMHKTFPDQSGFTLDCMFLSISL